MFKNLGYDENSYRGVIKFNALKVADLVDHAIGLKGDFEADDVTFGRYRFNIPDRKPLISGKPDRISIVANPEPAILTIKDKNGRSVSFEGDHRSFSLPGMPLKERKASFKNRFITATLYGIGKFRISYEFNCSEIMPLSNLQKMISFYQICKGEIVVTLGIVGKAQIETKAFHLKSDADEWHDWFDYVLQCLDDLDLGKKVLELSLDQLGEQAEHTYNFVQMLGDGVLTLKSNLFLDDGKAFPNIKNLLGFLTLPLGDRFLGVIIRRPSLDVEVSKNDFICRFGDPIILDARFQSLNDHNVENFTNKFKNIRKQMGKGTVVLNDGNLAINETRDIIVSQ